jgi:alpha-glucosidase (family GH31 glycosyl hydrolase)
MDMERYPTQKKVLTYARDVLASGLPPGVLIIDDFWHVANGVWEWNPVSFPDPRDMIRSLHEMGFPVMLWVCPYICADSRRYWELREKGFLLRNPAADPDDPNGMAIKKWWNGYSAIFDVSNPEAMDWLRRRLRSLVEEYGVDGFKFDGGDAQAYIGLDTMGAGPGTPNSRCEAYARLGEEFALSEYRACWKRGGKRQIQRIGDKAHAWGDNGLADIVPISIAQGLLGYPYVCPDMVGGGDVEVRNGLDQELFVRWAQVAMFWPIVQYSKLPGRILDAEHRELMKPVYALREELAPEMLRLADEAQRSGEPILRPMGYAFPEENMESVTDQFMVGERIMAAPVLRKGARSRTVRFPSGEWIARDGSRVKGPANHEVDAPLECIPWYRRRG